MYTANPTSSRAQAWSSTQAYLLAHFVSGPGRRAGLSVLVHQGLPSSRSFHVVGLGKGSAQNQTQPPQITPEQQKAMVEKAVAPLLAGLKGNPDDFDSIVKVANLFYDGQQYPDAVQYYERALKLQPQNADVITDLGTSFWYTGDADKAIAEFQTALKYQPGRASTLFNLGIVRWQGKKIQKPPCKLGKNCYRRTRIFPKRKSCRNSSNAPSNMRKAEAIAQMRVSQITDVFLTIDEYGVYASVTRAQSGELICESGVSNKANS